MNNISFISETIFVDTEALSISVFTNKVESFKPDINML